MKLNIEVDTSGLNFAIGAIKQAISEELEDAAHKVERTAKELVPVDTGALRSSIATSGGGFDYTITASTPYAKYIEDGTRPHIINGNPYLVWDGQIYDSITSVNHPGNRAYKYMETACDTHTEDIDDRIAEAISKVL
jgi:hypothetical protein